MNIWMFNHYAICPDMPGGTRHFDFGKELVERGHNISIFASSFHYTLLEETKKYTKLNYIVEYYNGVRFVWIKTIKYYKNDYRRLLNMISYMLRVLPAAIRSKPARPDVIIGSTVHLFAAYGAYLIAKRFKVPFVLEVRDLWPKTLIDMGVPKYHPFILLLGILERHLYARAKKIITLLPKAYEYIESLGVAKDKVIWIPNGVDLTRIPNAQEKSTFGTDFKVLYTGAFGKANNLEILLKAACILKDIYPNIRFILFGNGPEKVNLLSLKKGRDLENVEIRNPIKKAEVANIQKMADAFFFSLVDRPVFKYGISSNKLFDYLSSGKPVIFACVAGNNPIEEASAGISVNPNSPEGVAEAIVTLYEMPEEKRLIMGANGQKYIENQFNIIKLCDKLESMLSALTGKGYQEA